MDQNDLLRYPNLLNFLFYGLATELHQVDPNTVKPAFKQMIQQS